MQSSSLVPDQPVLVLLPNETLYSLATRFHCVSGGITPAATSKLLFGHGLAGMHHDFPGHVCHFSNRMVLQSPRNAVLRHTILPIYFPFHPAKHCENWIDRLLAGSPSSMKAELGLLASRFGASHPLKACPQCAAHDTATYGTPYWRVEHQLPGITACPTHRTSLMYSPVKVSGEDRFAWLMPTEARLMVPLLPHASAVAVSFAEIAIGLWTLPVDFEFDQEVLRQTYLTAAYASGLSDPRSRKFDLQAFRIRVSDVVELSNLAEYEPWLSESRAGESLVPRFVRMLQTISPRQMRHPLNHMILILALFTEWPVFWAAYQRSSLNRTEKVGGSLLELPPSNNLKDRSDAQGRLMELVRSGLSATVAAQLVGISTNTAIAWLASEGVSVKTRPKALRPQLRIQACLRLQQGEDKETVANAVGVSKQIITRLMFSEPGLHEHWQAARFSAAQSKARKEWTRSMQSCPEAASNEWRMLAPAAYAWLYRNDRAWLSDVIRNRHVPVRRRSTRVNWGLRDHHLETSILAAVRTGVDSDRPSVAYSVVELCTLVPLLKRHLGNLVLLPRTLHVLSFLCRRRSPLLTQSMPIR